MMLRALCQQLSKRWLFSWGNSPSRPAKSRQRLFLETLETRFAPSVDLFQAPAPTATTDVRVVNSGIISPAASPGLPAGFSPQQIGQAYGFNQISFNNGTVQGNGSGQTIAIIDAYNQPNIVSDLQSFDSTYGLAAPPSLTVVNQSGGSTLPTTDQGWGLETSLDVEWAHAIAPGAKILLVEANSSSDSDLFAAVNYARNQPGVSVISMSWGGNEWSGESYYDSTFTTPSGHNGVTFVASTGDSGSSGAPEYGSVSPNVLAVGGTQLSTDSAGNYLNETGWSGSGGGISAYESQPGYQKGIVTQTSTMRAVPDVAYDGSSASPFAVYDSLGYGGWLDVAGTSAGAPQWSALIAIADQGRALEGLGTLDGPTQTLPDLYKLGGSDFHDITSGSNGAYSAGPGYDLVTGLGTPIANKLVADLTATGAPTTPTGLSATAVSSSQINLSWNSVSGASSYTLERSLDDATWSVLATANATNYSDSGLLTNTTYYYRTDLSGANAVLSGLWFDPTGKTSGSNSATFVKTDTATQGSWQGVYGSQGYNVIDNAANYPSYATVNASGNSNWIWANSTTDTRALQDASGSGRIAATWYSPASFTVNVNITDGQTHQLALYLLDWDNNGRSERVQILDGSTGAVLSTQTASNFQNGQYLVWNVSGNIQIRITDLSGANAVLSGLFFDA